MEKGWFKMKLFKTKKTSSHNIITIAGIKFKFKRRLYLNKGYLRTLLNSIQPDKKNFLYLEYPFGNYVYDELAKYHFNNINIINFSLFKLFNVENRSKLTHLYLEQSKEIKKIIKKHFYNQPVNGLIVTLDWKNLQREVISHFKAINIPSVCIIHEGVFQDRDEFYLGEIPVSDITFVWGNLLRDIFLERGYSNERLKIIGSIKLNSYKYFRPKLSKNDFFKTLNLDPGKKTMLYCCQLCDMQWGDQDYALKMQENIIRSLAKIAEENDINLIIRNAPASPNLILKDEFAADIESSNLCAIDGKDINNQRRSVYTTEPGDCIYYSDIIIGLNTTMQLEASVLNKPAIVAALFDFDPKWHKELGLPICHDYNELKKCILENINKNCSLIDKDKKIDFYKDYGYSDDLNYNPLAMLEKELNKI